MANGPSRLEGPEPALVAAFALIVAAPLLLMPYVPGLDLPWHAAIMEIMDAGDPDRFLGYYQVDARMSSYLTLYYAVDWLANLVGGVPGAIRLVVGLYVVAFVWSARRLVRAFGGDGAVAVLAAPAAWSVTMEYGFVAYALGYPLTFWLWALGREVMDGRGLAWRLPVIGVLAALLAVTHPFAAALALLGLAVVVGLHAGAGSRGRALAVVGVALAGLVPAMLALATLAGDADPEAFTPMARHAGLWTRLTTHQFTPVLEAVAAAPARLFGYIPALAAFVLATVAVAAAVWARHVAGTPAREPGARGRTLPWLLIVLSLAYLITPFTFEWPRRWYGAQPRLLPLIWVVALAALRWRPRPGLDLRARAAPLAAGVLGVALVWAALAPLAAEARDLCAVIAEAAPRARTVALIEQRPTRERSPASPWRHAGAYVLVERGGFVANLPFTLPSAGNAGVIVPVHLAPAAPPVPPAPPVGMPWLFDPARHGVHYDQVLVRALAGDGPAVAGELVARRGRWRLYRRGD